MTNNSDWTQPPTILAWTALIGVSGLVLYYVIPAFGTAAGLFVAVSSTGLATAGVVSAWVAPAASGGVAVIGITIAVAGVKKVSESVQNKPYEWGLPLMAVFGGFTSTIARDIGLQSDVYKWLFGGITAFLIIVAGACYKRRSLGWKLVAVGLYLLPPLTLLGWSTLTSGEASFIAAFQEVSLWTWMGLFTLLMIGILIGILAHLDSKYPKDA